MIAKGFAIHNQVAKQQRVMAAGGRTSRPSSAWTAAFAADISPNTTVPAHQRKTYQMDVSMYNGEAQRSDKAREEGFREEEFAPFWDSASGSFETVAPSTLPKACRQDRIIRTSGALEIL